MKIKITSKIQEEKNFNYVLYTLHVTEANILDWNKLHGLFSSPDSDVGKWERVMLELDTTGLVRFRNVKENSFDIEISDWDDCLLTYLQNFLTENNLEYEEC